MKSKSLIAAIGARGDINMPSPSTGDTQIGLVLTIVFSLAGAIAVIIIIIGGIMYTTSSGDPQKTARAKDTILYACIGLLVVIMSGAIVGLVLGKIK